MNQTVKKENVFAENYNGILTHNGEIKVAKTNITAKILNLHENKTILVKGNKGRYVCKIHNHLKPFLKYVEVGDTAHVKFRKGKAWFVGFTKQTAKPVKHNPTGDGAVSENMNWTDFFNKIDGE